MKKLLTIIAVLLFSLQIFSQNKASGGPDSYGYSWIDSDEAGGPVYSWYDISGFGTPLNLGDNEISSAISLGFTFEYYGNTYNSVKVCSNGFISFTASSTGNVPTVIPNAEDPDNIIAPFWSDLANTGFPPGSIYYYYDSSNSRFVIQYQDYVHVSDTFSTHTFQIMLYADGEIIFQYHTVGNLPSQYTVGIENDLGTIGLQVAKDTPYLKNNLAVKFIGVFYNGTYDISTNALDYGNVNVGGSLNKIFTIYNLHASELMNGKVTTFDGYAVSEAVKGVDPRKKGKNLLEFNIPSNDSIVFNLLFEPVLSQTYNGSISITSSDKEDPTDSITVSGRGLGPDISVSQSDSILVQVLQGDSANYAFTIKNLELGDLNYSMSIDYYDNYVYKGGGGPDNYGYFWKDSDEPDGPTYNWYDISTLGDTLTLLDEDFKIISMGGMSFKFYGVEYTSVNITSNGYLQFGPDLFADWENTAIPNGYRPDGIIAGYWSDMDPEVQGNVFYYYDSANNRFITQYQDIANYGTTNSNTFQIILNGNGSIEYQYKVIQDSFGKTVGIENIDGTDATQICFNTPYLKDLFAVKFIPGIKWLTLTPNNGTIIYNDSLQITTECQSTELLPSIYYADIKITSNDPDTPTYTIPVEFAVYGYDAPNVTTSIVGTTLTLHWDDVPFASSYTVYSSSDPYGTYSIDSSGAFNDNEWSTATSASKSFYYVTTNFGGTKAPDTILIPEKK